MTGSFVQWFNDTVLLGSFVVPCFFGGFFPFYALKSHLRKRDVCSKACGKPSLLLKGNSFFVWFFSGARALPQHAMVSFYERVGTFSENKNVVFFRASSQCMIP